MSRRLVARLGLFALAWGCSRGPSREPSVDTLSLARLADSSGSEELRAANAPTRTDSQSAQVAKRTEVRTKPRVPARRSIAKRPSTAHPVDSAPTLPAGSPDTASGARASVGDSNHPTATAQPTATAAPPASGSAPLPPTTAPPTGSPAPGATPATAQPTGSPAPKASPATGAAGPTANAGPPANALPAGTQIRALLQDSISSLRNTEGQTVTATVSGDMRASDGIAVLPSGSVLHLTVDRLSPARSRSAKDGELVLRADSVTAEGHTYRVDARVQPVPHELRGRGVTAGEVEKVGAGAAAGAVVGAVATGRTKGAVVGGAVGAVGGAVVAAQTASRDVIVTPRTLITLILKSPIVRAE